jgi:hypothetical protein
MEFAGAPVQDKKDKRREPKDWNTWRLLGKEEKKEG